MKIVKYYLATVIQYTMYTVFKLEVQGYEYFISKY